MPRQFAIFTAAMLGCCLVHSPGPAATCWAQSSADLRMERVNLVDGRHYEGLIESEDDGRLYFIQVQRHQRQAMHLVIRPLERRSVSSVVRLDAAGRDKLSDQIAQFLNRAAIEAGRMEAVTLTPLEKEGNRYQHYAGKWFSLDSTADEQTTRRVIVRVEQVFAAYRQMLPPRNTSPQDKSPRRPRLAVFNSLEQYQAFLAPHGLNIQNTACFLEGENVVAVGSELGRLQVRLARVSAQTDAIRRDLDRLKKRLPARLAELAEQMRQEHRTPAEVAAALAAGRRQFDEEVKEKKKELERYERETAQTFQTSTRQMFARLYHESFHAYLENCVYPHDRYDVPRWLNEGLAVMFEGGILEGNALRVDAPNAAALRQLQASLAGPQPLGLEQLLSAQDAAFLQQHGATAATSDRLYAYAWGLAHYLAFEKHLLHSQTLDRYVDPEAKKLAPVLRFQRLVGMPLSQFEPQWRTYIRGLR